MGGKASTGAISTAAGELGAKYLTEHLYNKEAKDLTETERSQVKEIAKVLAGVAGGLAVAGQGASAVKILSESSIGTTVANNAVENNAVAQGDIHGAYQRLLNGEDIEVVLRDLEHSSQKKRAMLADCDAACRQVVSSLLMAANDFSEEQAIAIGSILSKIPAEQRSRVDMLVQSENSKTLEAIENSKSDVEKHIALAVKVMRFFQAENAVSGGKPNKPKLTKSSPDNKSIIQRNSINTTYKAKEELTDRLAAQMSKPLVNDPNLKKIMDDLYRENAKIGSGSTADAVRHENATGQPAGNKFHSIKAQNYSSALRKWIDKNPNASREDIRAAELVLRDLNNSLKGK
nr:VENN motif pre-toxin domain-containing protein [Haemophilus haemolyticus]